MATHFGKIDFYFTNVLSPKVYGGKRLMNLKGEFGKAILWFLPNASSLPDNSKLTGQDVFYIYYHTSDWEAVLDVLRNETPVYFNYVEENKTAQIYTGDEPVGEEETKVHE